MKRTVDADEWYPVYSVRDTGAYGGYEVEVSAEQVERWEAAAVAFEEAQDEMGELHRAAEEVARERAAIEKAEREAREKAERAEKSRQREADAQVRHAAIERTVGTVYDAAGDPVGEVYEDRTGLRARPIIPNP